MPTNSIDKLFYHVYEFISEYTKVFITLLFEPSKLLNIIEEPNKENFHRTFVIVGVFLAELSGSFFINRDPTLSAYSIITERYFGSTGGILTRLFPSLFTCFFCIIVTAKITGEDKNSEQILRRVLGYSLGFAFNSLSLLYLLLFALSIYKVNVLSNINNAFEEISGLRVNIFMILASIGIAVICLIQIHYSSLGFGRPKRWAKNRIIREAFLFVGLIFGFAGYLEATNFYHLRGSTGRILIESVCNSHRFSQRNGKETIEFDILVNNSKSKKGFLNFNSRIKLKALLFIPYTKAAQEKTGRPHELISAQLEFVEERAESIPEVAPKSNRAFRLQFYTNENAKNKVGIQNFENQQDQLVLVTHIPYFFENEKKQNWEQVTYKPKCEK